MREVEPAVVRVLDVPAAVRLPELHDLLQAALGWTDSHLHQFVADGISYGTPDLDGPEDERDESVVPLRALPQRFSYLYDFGDGWEHEVVVVGPGGEQPGVVAGEGACPPEDVGGPYGYAEFREAMADLDHPEHGQMRTWTGSWKDSFDLDATDLLVKQSAGEVPASVRLVLELIRDGVTLTPGGRLPRAFVRHPLAVSRRVATPRDRGAHGSWCDYGGAFAPTPARSASVRRRRRRGRGARGSLRRTLSA